MSQVLYRKYRPQTFAAVIGQDVIKTIIQTAVSAGKVSHAYLFTGPRGVGKTTVARLLAKAVNCLNPQAGEPDTICRNCQSIQEGRFLDLLEIDAASYTGVDNIREIIDHVKFSPSQGQYKVFIIDEVHMLSKAAFNALLKTLEEPPAHAIFILATTEIHKVPATIISRSQRFDFQKISVAQILSLLEKILPEIKLEIGKEARGLVALAAEGSFRDALSILDQLSSFGSKNVSLPEIEELLGVTRISTNQRFLDHLLQGQVPEAAKFVKDLTFSGKDLVQFTRNFLEYLHLVLLIKLGVEEFGDLGFLEEEQEKLREQSEHLTGSRLLEIIKGILEAHREVKTSPVPELPLLTQVLVLAKPGGAAKSPPPSPAVPAVPPKTLDLALGDVVDRWGKVLARVKDYNHSLLSSLRLGRIVAVSGGDLILAFPYNFHKETIEARKNRIVVEKVLAEVFGENLRVKVLLEGEVQDLKASEEQVQGDLMSEALKILGNQTS